MIRDKKQRKILLIGAGGAGAVVAKKLAQQDSFFTHLHIASRTKSKCDYLSKEIIKFSNIQVSTQELDADNTQDVIQCIETVKPDLVMNLALPYQNLSIMDACLACKVSYLDTANYEPRDKAEYAYHWQWAYHQKYIQSNIMALLGCGFDPGVTNVFCAYAKQYLFDTIETIDIIDCNDGDHGQAFATNFNPEINIREITQVGKYYESGTWHSTSPLSVTKCINFPEIGHRKATLINHEEMESLVKHIPGLKRIRFWMTFSENYLQHLKVCQNLGLTSIEPIMHKGQKIIPIEFLKTLLPTPSSLAKHYTGKTSIGCIITGRKNKQQQTKLIYNVCDHQSAYKDTQSQAVSYTTGVPAVVGAKLMLNHKWKSAGVWNMEQFDSKVFLDELETTGLSWKVIDAGPLE